MPKIRINISVDEEVSGMLKELAKAWHTTVSQLVTNWTLERYKELKEIMEQDGVRSCG